MSAHLVLTVIARDAPGIVEMLSLTVSDHGANWLGSHMARLAGEFAGIVELSVPEETRHALQGALRDLEARGLRIQIAEAGTPSQTGTPQNRALELELVGNDRPGIVHEISRALARRGVNVDELETGCESAAMSGDVLFRARARLQLPGSVTVEELRGDLERIAADLMVDLHLEEEGHS